MGLNRWGLMHGQSNHSLSLVMDADMALQALAAAQGTQHAAESTA